MSNIDLKKLKKTKDDDLLTEFPGYTRSELRRIKSSIPDPPKTFPKVLIFDIETAPIESYTWGIWQQNVAINQIKNDWFMLCYSAKWLFDDKVIHDCVTKKEVLKRDDKRIVNSLWKLMDEADIIIAHNGDQFDIKKANARFIFHNLPFPSPFRQIDTLKIAKRYFNITSNKLDYLCRYLGLPTKIDTGGFELWLKCIGGDELALKEMDTYCQNDVKILEELYLRLRSYDKQHPDVGLYFNHDGHVCPNCGSDKLKYGSYYTTKTNKYKTMRCSCGAIVYTKEKYV